MLNCHVYPSTSENEQFQISPQGVAPVQTEYYLAMDKHIVFVTGVIMLTLHICDHYYKAFILHQTLF